jgi:hypothetical protein
MLVRDSPVRRAIPRIGKPCRDPSFLMTVNSPTWITPVSPFAHR